MICPKCGRDMTNVVRLLGPDAVCVHNFMHAREDCFELRRLVEKEALKNCEIGVDALNVIGIDGSTYDRNHELLQLFDNLRTMEEASMTLKQAASGMEYFKAQIKYSAWVLRNPFTPSKQKERAELKLRLYKRGYSILKKYLWG